MVYIYTDIVWYIIDDHIVDDPDKPHKTCSVVYNNNDGIVMFWAARQINWDATYPTQPWLGHDRM